MRAYAGIGARKTPENVLEAMKGFAGELAERGFTLRTGGAAGADAAFILGNNDCDEAEPADLWLPWPGFRGQWSRNSLSPEAFLMAEKFHPMWKRLKPAVKRLHARNCHIVLGADLQSPVEFVLCWTEDGKQLGGTGQALRVARAYDVPIVDFALVDPADFSVDKFLAGLEGRR